MAEFQEPPPQENPPASPQQAPVPKELASPGKLPDQIFAPATTMPREFGSGSPIIVSGKSDVFVSQVDKSKKKTGDQPLSTEELLKKANTRMENGSFFAAIDFASAAIKQDQKNKDAYLTRAKVHNQLGYLPEAIKDVTAAINIDEKDADAYATRASYYSRLADQEKGQKQKLNEQALQDCNRADQLNPKDLHTLLTRTGIYHDLGKYQEAINDYSEAIKINPDPTFYMARGWEYYHQQKYEDGIKDNDKGIELERAAHPDKPNIGEALNNRGLCYAGLGQYDKALQDYEDCIKSGGTGDKLEVYKNRLEALTKAGKADSDLAKLDRDRIQKEEGLDKKYQDDKITFYKDLADSCSRGKISEETKKDLYNRADRFFPMLRLDEDAAELERNVNTRLEERKSDYHVELRKVTPATPEESNHPEMDHDRLLQVIDKKGKVIEEVRFAANRTRNL